MNTKMQASPLSLNHYQFLEFEIEPEPGYQSKPNMYPDIGGAEFKSRVTIGVREDDEEKDDFTVKLYLTATPKKKGGFPYHFKIGVQGFFTLREDFKVDDKQDFVLVNGATLLYGVLRDTLLNFTSRFEYSSVMIPTVNFLQLKGVLEKGCDEE